MGGRERAVAGCVGSSFRSSPRTPAPPAPPVVSRPSVPVPAKVRDALPASIPRRLPLPPTHSRSLRPSIFFLLLRVIRVSPALYPTATVPIRSDRDRMAGNGDGRPFPHGSRHGSSNDFPCVNQTPLVDQYVLCGLFVWHTVRPTGRVALSSVGRRKRGVVVVVVGSDGVVTCQGLFGAWGIGWSLRLRV